MSIEIFLITWYLVGFITLIVGSYFDEKQLKIKDLLLSLILSFFGFVIAIASLVYLIGKHTNFKDWLKRALERRIL